MKVRFDLSPARQRTLGTRETATAELAPTTHPKRGEAWTVTMDGAIVGVLRRWQRKEMTIRISPTQGSLSSRMVTRWTAYEAAMPTLGMVFDSRGEALRHLRGVPRA